MPPHTHIESAEAERPPETPKETTPDLNALSAAAADLGRRLAWLPGAHSPRFFVERYRPRVRSLKTGVTAFHGRLPEKAVGDDFHWLYDNIRLLHSDLHGM